MLNNWRIPAQLKPVGPVAVHLRVRQQGERESKFPGQLEQPVLGLKRHRQHNPAHYFYLSVLLSQLRQVFPSRQSGEVAEEDQQRRADLEIAQGHILAVGISQREIGRCLVKQTGVQVGASSLSSLNDIALLRLFHRTDGLATKS